MVVGPTCHLYFYLLFLLSPHLCLLSPLPRPVLHPRSTAAAVGEDGTTPPPVSSISTVVLPPVSSVSMAAPLPVSSVSMAARRHCYGERLPVATCAAAVSPGPSTAVVREEER